MFVLLIVGKVYNHFRLSVMPLMKACMKSKLN
uniref:Uncharacterized protein n=1 Tax=Cucumis melo TaxID=3656 RepID=A0A9I9EB31_CUCME